MNPIIKVIHYSQQLRRYELKQSAFAVTLIDLKVGEKGPTDWILHPCEYIYLISCLDSTPQEFILEAYANMNPQELLQTFFYLQTRKNSKLLRKVHAQAFSVYKNKKDYDKKEGQCRVKVVGCDDGIYESLFCEGIEKVAIMRNRDYIIIDVGNL